MNKAIDDGQLSGPQIEKLRGVLERVANVLVNDKQD
jgi:hypothetical protein